MLAFPSNHYKDKFRGRKSTPKLSAYIVIVTNPGTVRFNAIHNNKNKIDNI